MKHIAFALDPDGYWVEIISQRPGSKGADDPEEQDATTDPGTYRMVSRGVSGMVLSLFISGFSFPLDIFDRPVVEQLIMGGRGSNKRIDRWKVRLGANDEYTEPYHDPSQGRREVA